MIRLRTLLFFAILVMLVPELDAQCAMCKEAAESSMKDNPNSMARNLNKGILYLMAVPYLAIAFIFRKQIYELGKRIVSRMSKHKPSKV